MTRRAEYEYFVGRLDSPVWIEPMLAEGWFQSPPEPIRSGDTVQYPYWPEGAYLRRIASTDPNGVAKVLKQVPLNDNFQVHIALAEVSLVVDAVSAAEWARREAHWVRTQPWLVMGLSTPLAALVGRLARESQLAASIELARALFEVLPDREFKSDDSGEQQAPPSARGRMDAWEYWEALRAVLPHLTAHAATETLELTADLLARALEISIAGQDDGDAQDYSSIWRDAIELDDDSGRDVRDALVSAVRDAAMVVADRSGPQLALEILGRQNWVVFKRISLHLVRVAAKVDGALVSKLLLARERFDDVSLRHEFALLARDRFDSLDASDQRKYLAWIDEGPDTSGWVRVGLADEDPDRRDDEIQLWADHWRLERLGPVCDHLVGDWRERFDTLVKRHGRPDWDRPVMRVTSWSGYASPVTAEEALKWSSDELHAFLRDWTQDESKRDGTIDGVVATIRGLGTEFFVRESRTAVRWADLDARYVAALADGLRGALSSHESIEWEPVVELVEALTRSRGGASASEAWYSFLSLFLAVFDHEGGGLTRELGARVWIQLDALLSAELKGAAESDGADDNRDPLSAAINSVPGRALEGAIRFAVWFKRLDKDEAQNWSLVERLPGVASQLDAWARTRTRSLQVARSVFGLQMEPLMWLDEVWVSKHLDALLPSDDRRAREVVWDTYLRYGRPFGTALTSFAEHYERSVSAMAQLPDEKSDGREVARRCTEHLMAFMWQGLLIPRETSILARFFGSAPIWLRAHAIRHVGRSLNRSGEISDAVSKRLMQFVDWRIEVARGTPNPRDRRQIALELVGLGWWSRSEALDTKWMLGALLDVLLLTGELDPDYMVLERLVEVVAVDPRTVSRIFLLLVQTTARASGLLHWRGEVTQLLTQLRSYEDPTIQRTLGDVRDALVEKGAHSLLDRK